MRYDIYIYIYMSLGAKGLMCGGKCNVPVHAMKKIWDVSYSYTHLNLSATVAY